MVYIFLIILVFKECAIHVVCSFLVYMHWTIPLITIIKTPNTAYVIGFLIPV